MISITTVIKILSRQKNQKVSTGWFRSNDIRVMSPARFHCATVLLLNEKFTISDILGF